MYSRKNKFYHLSNGIAAFHRCCRLSFRCHCDTGAAADETIPADITVVMAAVKQGLLKLPAYEFIGELQMVEIGLPDDLDTRDAICLLVAENGTGFRVTARTNSRFTQRNIGLLSLWRVPLHIQARRCWLGQLRIVLEQGW